jgi:hypothetical protein
MQKVIAILFAFSCFTASFVSGNLLGVGIWFWILIAIGVVVAFSQFVPALQMLGSILALLLGIISILALLFGLLAATIGGAFELDARETLLFSSFFFIAVFGIALNRVKKNRNRFKMTSREVTHNKCTQS